MSERLVGAGRITSALFMFVVGASLVVTVLVEGDLMDWIMALLAVWLVRALLGRLCWRNSA